jgi:ATP-dependent Zn protease
MTDVLEHCERPWWKRPLVWFIGIAAVLALVVGISIEETNKRAPMPYGAFLDQLEAGNVASVTFRGTEIDGRFKHPVDTAAATSTTQRDTFRSHVPDFGDPTLISELRKRHVAIDVTSPSQWMSLLARIPWPIMLFFGAMIVAGVVKLARGSKAQTGTGVPTHPMQGIIGLVSGLFSKPQQAESPSARDSDEPKTR